MTDHPPRSSLCSRRRHRRTGLRARLRVGVGMGLAGLLGLGLGCRAAQAGEAAEAPEPSVAEASPTPEDVDAFRQALVDYEAGRFDEARRKLDALAARHPRRAGVWFWLARAARAQGDLDGADEAVRRALELEPGSADAHYLAALVRAAQGDRLGAVEHLDAVIALAPSSELGRAAARERDLLDWLERRDQARALVRAGRRSEAIERLEALDAERPGDVVVNRLLGRLLVEEGRAEAGLRHLDAALSVAPDHGWTLYWRAVGLRQLGRAAEADALFSRLAAGDDQDLATAARRRLSLDTSGGQDGGAAGSDRPLRWRLSLGWAVDTNPALVSDPDEVAVSAPVSGVALGATASWRPLRWRGGALRLSPGLGLRGYVTGPAGSDYGQLSLAAEASQAVGHVEGWLGAGAGLALLAWSPYLDRQQIVAGAAWSPMPWLQPRLELIASRREAHQDNYDNLDAVGVIAWPSLRLLPVGWLRLELAWPLSAEDARPYTVAWSGTTGEAEDVPYDAELSADASFRGHGPAVAIRLRPEGERFELDGGLRYTWRDYVHAERVDYRVGDELFTYTAERRDRRLRASVGVGAHLAGDTWLTARYAVSVNRSTLTSDVWPADRDFDRHFGVAAVELRR